MSLPLAGAALAACALCALAAAVVLMRIGRPATPNYRGLTLPVVLGTALAVALVAGLALVFAAFRAVGDRSAGRLASTRGLEILVGGLVVVAAGVLDDLRGRAGARGLRAHVGDLFRRGRVTTGMVKVVAGIGAGLIVAAPVSPDPAVVALGTLVIAGCANLWNLLDVRPGRSLKWFLVAMAGLALLGLRGAYAPVAAGAVGGAAALLPFDLRERAMLGDAGANLLGFLVGAGVFLKLAEPGWAYLGGALAVVLGLHVVAETVTLSRVIRAVPPLRWFDRLGRIPEAGERRG